MLIEQHQLINDQQFPLIAMEPRSRMSLTGFDHGAGHPLLFLDDAKAPNCQKNNGFSDLGNYSEWPKVAGAVIQASLPWSVRGWSKHLGLLPIA